MDLPVGQKMYDHPIFVGVQFLLNDSSAVISAVEGFVNIANWIDYFIFGKGLWTSIGKDFTIFCITII